jgi:hypothetical protein
MAEIRTAHLPLRTTGFVPTVQRRVAVETSFLPAALSPVAVFIPALGGLDRWSVRYKQAAPRHWASRLQKLLFVIPSPVARRPCLLFGTLLFSLLPLF